MIDFISYPIDKVNKIWYNIEKEGVNSLKIEKAIIKKEKQYIYNIYSDGNVTKTSVKDPNEETPVPRYKDRDGVFVWLCRQKPYVKRLVAKHFMNVVGGVIEHIDGNEENCSVDNLMFAKRDTTNDKKMYTGVIVDGVEYNSLAAAERALMVSQGYLTKYFNGQRRGKALNGHEVRLKE